MTVTSNTYEQVYNVEEDEGISIRVAHVICVLAERCLMAAGYSSSKELLTIHYTGYNSSKPVWELDFFEHLFGNEPLLVVKEKVRGVFIVSDRNMVVPQALYEENDAREWLKKIHFIENTDVVETYRMQEDNAMYLYTIPLSITELIRINFKRASLLPLAAYQFENTARQSLYLQSCVTNEQVCATLYNYSQLLWHKVFPYSCGEDIAYELRLLCKENNIPPDDVTLACNTISAAEYDFVNDVSQYFRGIKGGNGRSIDNRWDGAIYLAQQLSGCVL